MSDQGSRTVEDAAEAWTREYVPEPDELDDTTGDGDEDNDEDPTDGPCCNWFDCPCGGSGALGR